MDRFMLFGGLGIGCVVLLGLGVSYTHSADFFAPNEPDWLSVSQQNTVAVPESVPAVVTIEPAIQALDGNSATPIDPDALVASTPNLRESHLAPQLSVAPQVRPTLSAAVVVSPDVTGPALTQDTFVQPSAAAEQDVVVQQEFVTRTQSPLALSADSGSSLVSPPDVAQSAADPIDNVWMLGVFR